MKLAEIIDFLNPVAFQGESQTAIHEAKSLDDAGFNEKSIGWCSDKNIELLYTKSAGSVIISQTCFALLGDNAEKPKVNLIVVDNPRRMFSAVLLQFFTKKPVFGVVAASATIHPTVKYDPKQIIAGSNVVIEEDCIIGNRVIIDHNTIIKAGTVIQDDVKIGANCTIGGVGFGYEPNEDGIYEVIPHIGNVHLMNHVEIGNNVCIDRAVMGSTLLNEHVKVDNLVHIAHGVIIGKNSLVIANAMVAGSVQIGENSWISPSSSIKQKVKIGNNALVGLGSVVLKDVEDDSIVAGIPAKKLNKN